MAELVLIHNPPGKGRGKGGKAQRATVVSRDVHQVRYTHAADGQPYRHDFVREDVELLALEDGSLLLRSAAGRPLWQDFAE